MTISFDLLQTFVTYVETKNVVATAKLRRMSQPAVSAHLKKLGENLPVPVLVTVGRQKELTKYGEALYNAIRSGLTSVNEAVAATNLNYVSPENLRLTMAVRSELLPQIAHMFTFPGKIVYISQSTEAATEALHKNKIDVAIVTRTFDTPNFIAKLLLNEGVKFICHRRLLSKCQSLLDIQNVGLAAKIPFIAYRDPAPFIEQWLQGTGCDVTDLQTVVQCENWLAIASLVSQGRGFSLVPANIPISSSDVVQWVVPEKRIPPTKIYALYRKEFYKYPPLSYLTVTSNQSKPSGRADKS